MSTKVRELVYSRYREIWTQAGAETQSDNPRNKVFNRLIQLWLGDYTRSETDLVDLGAGDGTLVKCLRDLGFTKAFGVDSSPSQGAVNQDYVITQDVFQWLSDQPSERYDVIFAIDLIEHLSREELCDFFLKVAKSMKRGGLLICHCPNADSPFFGAMRYADLTHELAFTSTSLEQLCGIAEFSAYRIQSSGPVGRSLGSLVRKLILGLFGLTWWVLRVADTGDFRRSYPVTSNIWVRFTK
jgi:SAM-dependent methyltransferase